MSRLNKLGIKQTIQKSWMDRVLNMMLAGMSESEIRKDLDCFLATQKQSGGIGERGKKTYGIAISILACWFDPDESIKKLRDKAFNIAKKTAPYEWLPLHWAVISAAYPFWYNVAQQVGRILNLQDRVTQKQVFNRVKENYGDRETVARNARYTVRSFIAWSVLNDSPVKGSYEKNTPFIINHSETAVLLLEAALHTRPEGKGILHVLLKDPALFPFSLPNITADMISQGNNQIEVINNGLEHYLLKLANLKEFSPF